MSGLNRSILAGRLVADPEVRYTREETAVANFRIAIKTTGKEANFINCVAKGNLAKICGEYLKKGKLVAVEGKLQIRKWSDKSGRVRTETEVLIEDLQMLDSRMYQAGEKAKEKP